MACHLSMLEWDPFAPYYDLFFQGRTVDINFWVTCSKQYGPTILEFSCGTGRLTLPIARSGAHIVGIDISQGMLKVFNNKLSRETKSIQNDVRIIKANAMHFTIPDVRFNAIISPWGFPAVTDEDQISLIQSVQKHLVKHGIFIVDIYNFNEPKENTNNSLIQECKYIPEKRMTITRHGTHKVNVKKRTGYFVFQWDIINAKGKKTKITTKRIERIYTKIDMEIILKSNGFSLLEIYGNYDKSSWSTASPRSIFIARKQHG